MSTAKSIICFFFRAQSTKASADMQPSAGLQNRSVVVVAVGFVRRLIGDMGTVMNNEH